MIVTIPRGVVIVRVITPVPSADPEVTLKENRVMPGNSTADATALHGTVNELGCEICSPAPVAPNATVVPPGITLLFTSSTQNETACAELLASTIDAGNAAPPDSVTVGVLPDKMIRFCWRYPSIGWLARRSVRCCRCTARR